MALSRPLNSDGPDPVVGGPKCLGHHAGVRTDVGDWCCCCNPCLYDRPVSPENPCRCVQKLICFVFRGDAGQRACCDEMTLHAFATEGSITYYSATFPTNTDITLSIHSDLVRDSLTLAEGSNGLPAYWRLQSTALGIDEIFRIDHVVTTCLAPPAIAITGVTVNTPSGPCVGTVTIEMYQSEKLTFRRLDRLPNEDIAIPPRTDPLCKCDFAVDVLCVWGRRKIDGPIESALFGWDRNLNDRWSYSPPCGGLNTQEHIYLRGDEDGNCYLELDFDQTGASTNDWAVPPNTFNANNPHDIRPGMLPIDSCVCGLTVRSMHLEVFDNRYVSITGGHCERYGYRYCGKCRCVPKKLCVVGSIDGQIFQGQLTWDGEQWASAGTAYIAPFSLSLTTGECSGPPAGRTDPDSCAIQVDGTFLVPFGKSAITECGPRLSFSLTGSFDPAHPSIYNWMYGHASLCGGCRTINCGPCLRERCGGPPDVLYADLEAVWESGVASTTPPYTTTWTPEVCNTQVRLVYYQRWMANLLICGYIGTVPIPGGGTFILDWQYFSAERFQMTRITATGTQTESVAVYFPYAVCEPFLRVSSRDNGPVMGRLCAWGADYDIPDIIRGYEWQLTLSE